MPFLDATRATEPNPSCNSIIAWKASEFPTTSHNAATSFVSVQGLLLKSQVPIFMVSVYGHQSGAEKTVLLHELKTHVQSSLQSDMPTLIAGDFNLIAAASDKN